MTHHPLGKEPEKVADSFEDGVRPISEQRTSLSSPLLECSAAFGSLRDSPAHSTAPPALACTSISAPKRVGGLRSTSAREERESGFQPVLSETVQQDKIVI